MPATPIIMKTIASGSSHPIRPCVFAGADEVCDEAESEDTEEVVPPIICELCTLSAALELFCCEFCSSELTADDASDDTSEDISEDTGGKSSDEVGLDDGAEDTDDDISAGSSDCTTLI